MTLRVLDLFSGLGGFALGLHRAGMATVAFCEREPFCQRVLAKHWPEVPIYDDIRTLTAARLHADGIAAVDAICGGFPCQPFSVAGKRQGTSDERHLWPDMARLIGELRPRWVIGENVPGIRTSAADLVLGDLESLGYACGAFVVGADDVGAPHRRKRVWFVAHARRLDDLGWGSGPGSQEAAGARDQLGGSDARRDAMAHAEGDGLAFRERVGRHLLEELEAAYRAGVTHVWPRWGAQPGLGRDADGPAAGMDGSAQGGVMFPTPVARGDGKSLEAHMAMKARMGRNTVTSLDVMARSGFWPTPGGFGGGGSARGGDRHAEPANLAGAVRMWASPSANPSVSAASMEAAAREAERLHPAGRFTLATQMAEAEGFTSASPTYAVEPWERGIPRVVPRGAPNRTHRLKALGNAVVPQVVEAIGRAVLRADAELHSE